MDFLKGLKQEAEDLSEKYKKLEEFKASDKFTELNEVDSNLLVIQSNAMLTYLSVLNSRINRIEKGGDKWLI